MERMAPMQALRNHVTGAIERGDAVAVVEVKMSPIAMAVQPLRAQAEESARQAALDALETARQQLEAGGWDRQIVAPYPQGTWRMSKGEYRHAVGVYQWFNTFTRWVRGSYSPKEPHICVWHQEGADRFVKRMVEEAGASFEAFVVKLEAKVGEHSAARMLVNGTWNYSIVEVTTPTGVTKWKTQQILNVSCLGKLFNQWPTRQIK